MSKQSDAKKNQNYQPKPVWPMCMNCWYYKSDFIHHPTVVGYNGWSEEKNKRCAFKADFAVGKSSTCDFHYPVDGVVPAVTMGQL